MASLMGQNHLDGHLKKDFSSKCELHPTQKPKYYCSNSKCRALLCVICMKTHPKEHISTLTTLESVKAQTLKTLKNEALSRVDKLVEGILKSSKMNHLFKEALGTLMQQNTTVDLDEEDIADILADTLERRYLDMKFTMNEKIQENISIESSRTNLIAFDFQFDASSGRRKEFHVLSALEFCQQSLGYYCQEALKSFYAKSKGQGVFWSMEKQTLICQDIINPGKKWKKYQIPLAFDSLTVIDSERLLFVAASKNQLTVYSIEEEESEMNNIIENEAVDDSNDEIIVQNYPPLKTFKEFPQEEEILFVASDHVNNLFVVTEGESGLTATIYELKSQDNQLELTKIFSFEPFDLPKKVVFDQVNKLLFILGDDVLEAYKYPAMLIAPLQVIFKTKAEPFHWHQATKRLLLIDSGKLYQFNKGNLRLIRGIQNSMKPVELTHQGILCLKGDALYLVSYKNPNLQKQLVLPVMDNEMGRLQEESFERFYSVGFDSEVDPDIGELRVSCNKVKIACETPDYLLIYANVTYYQHASQKLVHRWADYGGTIYSQRLLKYNISPKEYQILEEEKPKDNH